MQDLEPIAAFCCLAAGLLLSALPALATKRQVLLILCILPCLMYCYSALRLHHQDALLVSLNSGKLSVRGRVSKIMAVKEGASLRFMVRPDQISGPPGAQSAPGASTALQGLILCNSWSARTGSAGKSFVISPPPIAEGDFVEVRGKVRLPAAPAFPWDFDEKSYFRRQGVVLLMTIAPALRKLGPADKADLLAVCGKTVDRARGTMLSFHRRQIGHDFGDLLSSMVIGSKVVQLSEALSDKFRDIGLSHILAASGFNLTLVIAMTYWSTKFLLRSKWLVIAACFAAMSAFVALAGLSASVERAAMMSSIVLLLQGLMRSPHLPAILTFALLVTCLFDPGSVFDIGLQLSYAATLGIICGVAPASVHLAKHLALPTKAADALAVVLVAQASVLPLQMLYFWNVGLLFLPANLLIVPMVPLITITGFASSICCLFPSGSGLPILAGSLDFLALLPLSFLLFLVNYFASIEWAKMSVGPPFVWAVVAYFISLIALICALKIKRWERTASALFAFCLLALFWRQTLPELTLLHFGASVLIIDGDHQAVVVGKTDNLKVRRCLSYFCADSDEAANFSITQDGPNTQVVHVPTNTQICIVCQAATGRSRQQLQIVSPAVAPKPGQDQVYVLDRASRRFSRILKL